MKRKKNINLNTMVRIFLRDYNIPTKKDVDRILSRLERLEQIVKRTAAPMPKKSVKTRAPAAASDMVIDIIRDFKDGASFSDIQKITDFEEKKLRNIIYRLNKLSKIKRVKRGIYIVP